MSCHRNRPVYRRGDGAASDQPRLVSDALEERLEGEPFVLKLRALVESVLGDELRSHFPSSGGYSYDPVGLFCVWMYGTMKGVTSSRRLEEACLYDVRYEYLCRSCRPDHTTLSRFRRSLESGLDELFARVAIAAREQAGVTGRVVMVDGTKIPASRSQWKKLAHQVDVDDPPDGVTMQSYGKFFYGYNVQMALDADSGFVLGVNATLSPNDLASMEGIMYKVQAQSDCIPECVVTDKGYSSHPNAHALDSRGICGLLPPFKSPAPFSPLADGRFQCQAGHIATEIPSYEEKYKIHYRLLRVSKCTHCPLTLSCGNAEKTQRRLKVPALLPAGDLRKANLNALDPKNQTLMKNRGPTIERVFAILKWCMGLHRFKLRTLNGAQLEFGITALAYNIRRLIRAIFDLIWSLLKAKRASYKPLAT